MGENLVAGILKSIEIKSEISLKINSQILTAVQTTNNILSKEIGGELKKQTKLLQGILKGISGKAKVQKEAKSTPGFGSLFVALLSPRLKKNIAKINKPFSIFVESVEKLVEAVNKLDEGKWGTFMELLDSGKKILLFATFTAIAAPLLLISLMFTMPLLYAWVMFFKFLKMSWKNVLAGSNVLMYLVLSTSIAILTMVILAYSLGNPVNLLIAGLIVVGTLLVITLLYSKVIKSQSKDAMQGGMVMMWLAITTVIVVGTIILVAYLLANSESLSAGPLTGAALIVLGSLLIVALAYKMISNQSKELMQGGTVMLVIGIVTALVVGIIIGVAYLLSNMDIGDGDLLAAGLLVAGSLLIVAGAFAIIGLMDKQTKQGAITMLIVAASIAVLAGAVWVWMQAKPSKEDLIKLALTIGVLALVGTILGIPPIVGFAEAGALVMLTLSASLLVLSTAMLIWTKANVSLEQVGILTVLIVGLSAVYSGLGFAAPFILLGSAAILPMAASLLVLSTALLIFDKAGWTQEKTDTLKGTITGITTAFRDAFAEMSWQDALQMLAGAALLASIGMSLGALADGLSKFAAGYAPIYEVNDKGEVVVVGTTPLDAELGQRVGETIAALINPLIGEGDEKGVLAKLGAEADSWWGESDVSRGIRLVGDIGNAIGGLASGLTEFGKGYVVTKWGTDKKGNPIAVETTPIDETFATTVGNTINTLISPMIKPDGILAKLGKADDSFWGDSDVAKGIRLVGDIGNAIGTFAEGMINMAQLKIPIYGKDKNGKPTIVNYRTWTETDSANVAANIDKLVTDLINPLKNLSKYEDEIEDGSELLGALATPLADISKGLETLAKVDTNTLRENVKTLFSGLVYFSDGFKYKVDSDAAEDTLEALGGMLTHIGKVKDPKGVGQMFIDINASINKMPLDKLKELKSIMQNLKDFAEEMDGSFSDLAEVMEKLATVMADMDKAQQAAVQEAGEPGLLGKAANAVGGFFGGGDDTSATTQDGQSATLDLSPLIQQLQSINDTLQGGIEVEPKGGGFLST